jgi:phage terminase large subunit
MKGLLVANPGPEDHWVYRRFVDETTKEPQTRRVSVTLYDNQHNLDTRYVQRMLRRAKTNPLFYRRYLLGEWGAFGGKRFPDWNEERHVVEPFDIPSGWEIVQGIDYGWANPTCGIYCAINFEGRWYIVAEHYESEKPISFHAKAFKEIEVEHNISPSSRWLDPSAWAKKSEYEAPAMEFADWNIDCGRAQNDRLGGWNRIEEMLYQTLEDGKPRLQIFSRCKNLIRELPNLKIKVGTDDVEKENDHAADALRYAIMSRMPHPDRPEEEKELDMREVAMLRLLARAREHKQDIRLI